MNEFFQLLPLVILLGFNAIIGVIAVKMAAKREAAHTTAIK